MEQWTLTKEFCFEAAHRLHQHDGKCARLHGHSWRGRVIIKGTALHPDGSKQNMLEDYAGLKAVVAPLLDNYLDHYCLNESLEMYSPTSEAVARWIYDQVSPALGALLLAVEIDETCTSSCRYERISLAQP